MNSKKDILNKICNNAPHMSWIKDNTVFLTTHGSRAYGTNTEDSDYDYKGVAIPTVPYYLGFQNKFEQAELKEPDTAIYEIKKFFSLASSCNPNIIEVLFTDPSDHVYVDSIGEEILNAKDSFLSKRVRHTFAGYARSQLNKMELHRRWLMKPVNEPPTRASLGLPEHTLIPKNQLEAASAAIQKDLDKFKFDFMEELTEPMKMSVRSTMAEMLAELKITTEEHWLASARKIGLNDNFIELMQKERAYASKKSDYNNYQNWKKTRNPKRSVIEAKWGIDLKNAYHLVRLLRVCKEILSTGKVLVKRPDREELLAIRNGAWSYEQIIEHSNNLDIEIEQIYKTSNVLPKIPDIKKLDNLCSSLVEKSLSKYSIYNIKKNIKKLF